MTSAADPQFDGLYGTYVIDANDRRDVQRYRIALLVTGLSLTAGLAQWWLVGGTWAWCWCLPLCAGLGVALQTIHIYLRSLHRALRLFWLVGCLGWATLLLQKSPEQALSGISAQPLWILAVGPLFAALTGIGFKEFFCFRRIEAIGLTVLVPPALLGRLLGWVSPQACFIVLFAAALLLVVLALRKFGNEAAADVGDKSVFAYLDAQVSADNP